MTKPALQLALMLGALATMAAVAITASGSGEDAPRAEPAPTTSTSTTVESAAADSTTSTTLPPATTTTSLVPETGPRELTVRVYPSSAEASMTVSDGSTDLAGSTEVEGTFTGPVSVEVEATGFASESLSVDAGTAGIVEVWLDPPDQVVDKRMVFNSGAAPKQVAFTPDGTELWVTLLAGSGLEAYDPITGELIAAINLPEAGSVEVIFNKAGDTAYVSQMETASVYEIDVATHSLKRTLDTEGSWTKVMLLSPDETRLWASNWVSNDVSEFELATGEMVKRFATVTTPRGLATDASGTKLYVAGYDTGDIEVFDLATGESSTIYESGGAMRHMVADPDAGLVYVSDMAKDSVFVIDTETDEVTTLGSTNRLPNTIDLTPDGRVLAVSNRARNNPESYYLPGPEWGSVLLLDTDTGAVLDAVVGGNQPTGLDISSDGKWLAFSDFLDNRISVFALPDTETLLAAGGGRAESHRAELTK